jgi:hypothetical protein
MSLKYGTPEYWAAFRDDAWGFDYAAQRLCAYQPALSWWGRWVSSFVIGFLQARSRAMYRVADAEQGLTTGEQ